MMSERRILENRIRRQRELRKNVFLFIVSVAAALSISLLACSFLSNAKDYAAPTEYKYYASIPVASGDTLWSIAQSHMGTHYESVEDYVSELKIINSLKEEKITTGMYLIIPYYSTEFSQ